MAFAGKELQVRVSGYRVEREELEKGVLWRGCVGCES